MARSAHDAPELLGVEMDEAAWLLVLVAHDRLALRLAGHETLAPQHAMTGGRGQAEPGTEPVGTPAGPSALGHDGGLLGQREAARAVVRSRARVDEAVAAPRLPARQPPVEEATADAEGGTGRRDGHPGLDGLEDLGASSWCQRGACMTMHRGALPVVELVSALNLAGDGLPYVTNVVRGQN